MALQELDQPPKHYEAFSPETREALIKDGKEIRVIPFTTLTQLLEKDLVELGSGVNPLESNLKYATSGTDTEVAFDPNHFFLVNPDKPNEGGELISEYSHSLTARIPGTKAVVGNLTAHILLNLILERENQRFLLESLPAPVATADRFGASSWPHHTREGDPMLLTYEKETRKLIIAKGRDNSEGYDFTQKCILPLILPLNKNEGLIKRPMTIDDLEGPFKATTASAKPSLPENMEVFNGIPSFTAEQMKALVEDGYYIYASRGRTVREIAEEFKKHNVSTEFFVDLDLITEKILSTKSISSAVAVNPDRFSFGKFSTLVWKFEGQKDRVKDLKQPKGVESSVMDIATFMEIALQYFKETGLNLLERQEDQPILSATEIKTEFSHQIVGIGYFSRPQCSFYIQLKDFQYANSNLRFMPINFMCIPATA